MTQFADQIRIKLISQLIKDVSRALQKLLYHFNGTIISTFFVLSSSVSSVFFFLILIKLIALFATKLTITPS